MYVVDEVMTGKMAFDRLLLQSTTKGLHRTFQFVGVSWKGKGEKLVASRPRASVLTNFATAGG
jgi:hypothetical protein